MVAAMLPASVRASPHRSLFNVIPAEAHPPPEGDCIPFRNISGLGVLLMREETFGKGLKTPSREGGHPGIDPKRPEPRPGRLTYHLGGWEGEWAGASAQTRFAHTDKRTKARVPSQPSCTYSWAVGRGRGPERVHKTPFVHTDKETRPVPRPGGLTYHLGGREGARAGARAQTCFAHTTKKQARAPSRTPHLSSGWPGGGAGRSACANLLCAHNQRKEKDH